MIRKSDVRNMNWLTIASLLIAFEISLATAYQDFAVKNLCPRSELKSAFNQLYNNRPGIQLYNQSDSAASVHQIWTEDNLQDFQDCVFTVDSNLYSEYGRFGRGLFVSIQKLNFRQNSKGECIDYLRFSFDGSRTEKICGSFDVESELGKQSFFNDGGGIIKVHIFVNKSIPLQGLQRSVEVDILLTAYEKCSTAQSYIRCHPSEDDFCISGVFRNDGIHNCPPPYSSDEPKLSKQEDDFQQHNTHQNPNQNQNHHQHVHYGHRETIETKSPGGVAKCHIQHSLFYLTALIAFSLCF